MPIAEIWQPPLLEGVIEPLVGVNLLSAAFGESRLNEGDLTAQHVGGFTAEFGLLGHEIEKGFSVNVQDFGVSHCESSQAVGPSRKSGGNPQERTRRKDAIELWQVLDRQTDLAFQNQVNPMVLLIHLEDLVLGGVALDHTGRGKRFLQFG